MQKSWNNMGDGKPIDSVIAVIDEGMKGRHGKSEHLWKTYNCM